MIQRLERNTLLAAFYEANESSSESAVEYRVDDGVDGAGCVAQPQEDLEKQGVYVTRVTDTHGEVSGEKRGPRDAEKSEHGAEDLDRLALGVDRVHLALVSAVFPLSQQHPGNLEGGSVFLHEALELDPRRNFRLPVSNFRWRGGHGRTQCRVRIPGLCAARGRFGGRNTAPTKSERIAFPGGRRRFPDGVDDVTSVAAGDVTGIAIDLRLFIVGR